MGRFRFSMTTFLVVVTLLAAGMAAFVSGSAWASSAAYTVFLALLCLATAGAILGQPSGRAFWLGCALFGWCYWFVEYKADAVTNPPVIGFWGGSSSRAAVQPNMVSTELLGLVESALDPNLRLGGKVMAQWRGGAYYSGTVSDMDGSRYLIVWDDGSAPQWTPANQIASSRGNAHAAGHAVLGLLFGLIGGGLVSLVFGQARRQEELPRVSSTNSD